ncbi:phage gp6-like head-tail connector protein [Vibrio cholerae]
MHYKILNKTSQSEELIPLETLMEYLRVYDYQEEALVEFYREAAIDFAEAYTNRLFRSANVVSTLPTYKKSFYLPLSNTTRVEKVTAFDKNNKLIVIDNFRFNPVSSVLTFTSDYSNLSDFEVHHSVCVPPEEVPHAVKIGVMKLVATWYENREDIANGVSATEIPMNHKHCFDLYRLTPTS